jgi:hypothetical protein
MVAAHPGVRDIWFGSFGASLRWVGWLHRWHGSGDPHANPDAGLISSAGNRNAHFAADRHTSTHVVADPKRDAQPYPMARRRQPPHRRNDG